MKKTRSIAPMRVKLEIEELRLTGFPPAFRHVVGSALEARLQARIAAAGAHVKFAEELSEAELSSLKVVRVSSPAALGRDLADQLFQLLCLER